MVEIIAEIGWNHMGDIALAKKMVLSAAKNGADFAKFQTWSLTRLKNGPWDDDGRREIYQKAELDQNAHVELRDYCNAVGIKFLSSVFSVKDVQLLKNVSREAVKIPSYEIANLDLLRHVNEEFERVFLSTGAATLEEIARSMKYLDSGKTTLLHCVSVYPCKPENANLSRINDLKPFCISTGYSDHVRGVEVAKMSLEFDIRVIEKHFTTDPTLPGRDNKFAIIPDQLLELRRYIDDRSNAMIFHGTDYQDVEEESRNTYRGRFDG